MPIYLHATAHAVPDRVVPNAALTQFPSQMLPVIGVKTGILERRHADAAMATSDLAVLAGRRCLERAGIRVDQLGGIVVGTCTPDKIMPPTGAIVHDGLQAPHQVFAFDINAVCSSAVYALAAAAGLVRDKPVLVIAADAITKHLNPNDFGSYPYFGDGAAAVLIGPSATGAWAELDRESLILGCDGSGQHVIEIPAGGTREPATVCTEKTRLFFRMVGKQVMTFALEKGGGMIRSLTERAGGADRLHAVVLHQANINIIHGIADQVGLPRTLFPVNLDRYGNTGGPGVLIALDELARRGPIPAGQSVLMGVFGGGLAWAGCRLTSPAAIPASGA